MGFIFGDIGIQSGRIESNGHPRGFFFRRARCFVFVCHRQDKGGYSGSEPWVRTRALRSGALSGHTLVIHHNRILWE